MELKQQLIQQIMKQKKANGTAAPKCCRSRGCLTRN